MFKRLIDSILASSKKFFPLNSFLRYQNKFLRRITSASHHLQYKIDWVSNNPESFDHYLDLYWQWKKTRKAYPMERGVFSNFAIRQGAEVLDLCCGDGFNAYYFYSIRSRRVVSVDFDAYVIKWAKRNNSAKNIEYKVCDIRNEFPEGLYDNVIWDAAIEHFTADEIKEIMPNIKKALRDNGVLSGHTIMESITGVKHLHQHEYEFHDKEDLLQFLKPWFNKVHVFTTHYDDRINLYFYATDSSLPFETEQNLYFEK